MPGAEVPGPPVPGDHAAPGASAPPHVSRPRSRVQVTPHRLVVVLLVREFCHYKLSVPVTPQDRTAACLLLLDLVQSPDLDLATTCSKYVYIDLNQV